MDYGRFHWSSIPLWVSVAAFGFYLLGTAFSLWALLLALVSLATLLVRTALEDRLLQEELEGYVEYAGRVRYRLIPGVW